MPGTDPTATDPLRRALAAVQDMRSRLEKAEAREHEPVAIVGLACRFPGGDTVEAWWETLRSGADAVTEVPASRWDVNAFYDPDPDAPGKMSTRWGGFITDAEAFDAPFFGISPREAVGIDPQQRLLLQTAWHALEDAGIAPDRLAGSNTGVYVGISTQDYARVLSGNAGAAWVDAHASTGNALAVAAGRLSYSLGLQGPSLAIDTACSSSLVAVHQAVRALRSGEVSLALAAGVNLTLLPELTIGFSKARMMAADGHCKTFDAAADGYVRGEGCGVVVLKRLADALADGDLIHALIRGSAVNHDGRSAGLTAPNGPAQVAVIRAALADARIDPAHVSLIEAHGTGTTLGDPIEARALGEVFGGRAAGTPAPWLASVKTQVGHLEAAAGIAGLIKLALCLRERTVAPHLHFRTLNPHIAADGFDFRIPRTPQAWEPVDGRWIAGVSSFGFSGTNAHVIVEAAPARVSAAPAAGVSVLAISAREPEALDSLRRAVGDALRQPGADLAALANTLGAGRAHHGQRLAVAATDAPAAATALARAPSFACGEPPPIAFLFTGQGCQYGGMAAGLLAQPRFRDTLARCDDVLADTLGGRLADFLAPAASGDLTRTDRLQPILFALEYAMADLWRSWGVQPAAVLGHSLGEIAAACFAGALPLEEALAFVAERGRLMHACRGRGGMAAVLQPAERVREAIAGTGAVLAADNAPEACVIAGDDAALARALAVLEQAGAATQRLEVATAFHAPALDDCLDALEAAARRLTPHEAGIPIASNLTGECVYTFEAGYWRRQAREAVRFREGFAALTARGIRHFVEVGPHPVLSAFGRAQAAEATFVASLRRGADAQRTFGEAVAQLYTAGAALDWPARHDPQAPRARAPRYPFARERHWPATSSDRARPSATGAGTAGLAPTRIASPLPQHLYEVALSLEGQPFLGDHVVFGKVVVPGALHAVTALAVMATEGHEATVEDLVFEQALELPSSGTRLQAVLDPEGALTLSAQGPAGDWVRHASARVGGPRAAPPAPLDLASLRQRLVLDDAGPGALFAQLAERGIQLGPAFQGTTALWRGDGEALAEIHVPPALAQDARAVALHPASLDACFQALGATFRGAGTQGGFLPLSVDRLSAFGPAPARFFCHVRAGDGAGDGQVAVGHFTLSDAEGRVFLAVEGLQIKRVEVAAVDPLAEAFLALRWEPAPAVPDDWSAPEPLVAAARAKALKVTSAPGTREFASGLERLADAYARAALDALGSQAPATDKARLHARVQQLASMHRESGDPPAAALEATLRQAHPDQAREIDLVARCGRALAGVLRGEVDPLPLLFPAGEPDDGGLYGASGLAQSANDLVAATVATAIARRRQQPIRVLEVGGGTGATTAAVLPMLATAPGSTYRFTDISPAFLPPAAARFGAAIETAVLDLEDAAAIDAQRGRYDVVIAANVVHATADVAAALAHLRQLLAPQGALVLLESTTPQRWWDIVFGLTPGWWRFTDTRLRPDHPLLDATAWDRTLRAAGFGAVAQVGADDDARLSVLVARRSPPPLLVVTGDGGAPIAEAKALADAWKQRGAPARIAHATEAARELSSAVVASDEAPSVALLCSSEGERALHDAFDLVRAMLAAGRDGLTIVTRGARGPAPVTNPSAAMAWGLADVAALEHPELRLRCVDQDPAADGNADALAYELLATDESRVAWRNGVRHACRLARASAPPPEQPLALSGGTCLVTGAFGGLGPRLAEWLAAHGAGALVLTGRTLPDETLATTLRALPARVELRALDVTDESALAALLADVRRGLPPIKAVFHLAGSVADGALVAQDWPRFASVLGAKATGASLLDKLVTEASLRHFVLFSTSASLIGNRGQANHAAANAFLDALAHARRARGLPALSINWGAWSEAGAVASGDYERQMAARGVRAFSPAIGLAALERAMSGPEPQVGVVMLDWARFLADYGETVPAFFSAFASRARATAPGGSAPRASRPAVDLRAVLAACAPPDRPARLGAFLLSEAAAVLGMADPSRIDPEQALSELGLDSLLALELRNRLGTAVGARQPATLLFNYPSVSALAQYFGQALLDAHPVPAGREGHDEGRVAQMAALSDEEAAALIDQEFAALQKN